MSKADILQEISNLGRKERREILDRIWEMEEADVLRSGQPDAAEKALLDGELEEYQSDPGAGTDWKEVEARVRRQLAK